MEQRVNVRERLHRWPVDGVETPVFVADVPRPVGLLREHDGGSVSHSRVLDPPEVEEVDGLRAQLCQPPFRQPLHQELLLYRCVARLDD
jgi:hypothetical protein